MSQSKKAAKKGCVMEPAANRHLLLHPLESLRQDATRLSHCRARAPGHVHSNSLGQWYGVLRGRSPSPLGHPGLRRTSLGKEGSKARHSESRPGLTGGGLPPCQPTDTRNLLNNATR